MKQLKDAVGVQIEPTDSKDNMLKNSTSGLDLDDDMIAEVD